MSNAPATVKFLNREKSGFFPLLKSRVDAHFQQNTLAKTGGQPMVLKAVFMLCLYLIPYGLILSNQLTLPAMLLCTIIMGFGIAGVGMAVMHDANHGSFSANNRLNQLFSASLFLLGGNVYNWRIQHNLNHHTYTNIDQLDEDITGKPFLRLSTCQRYQFFHRYQHVYAFLLYTMMTLSFLVKDIRQVRTYRQQSKSKHNKPFPINEILILILGKLFYVAFVCVLPLWLTNLTFGQWLTGYLVMNAIAGLILSLVFQVAHLVEGIDEPVLNHQGCIENAWAIHQLESTANFKSSKAFSWFIGGLDHQIEHHLFPAISHVHYPAIAPIVRATAEQFGLTYHQKSSFLGAIHAHTRMLKQLGSR